LAFLGFVEAKLDPSLFIYLYGDSTVYLLLCVDDIVQTTSHLERDFAMKDLGPLHHFLGVFVEK
jgi:hypothetical protein